MTTSEVDSLPKMLNLIHMIIYNVFLTSWTFAYNQIFFIMDMRLLLLSRFSRVQLCVTPETAALQAPPSLGFSRQEHWSGLPFPSPMHESEK